MIIDNEINELTFNKRCVFIKKIIKTIASDPTSGILIVLINIEKFNFKVEFRNLYWIINSNMVKPTKTDTKLMSPILEDIIKAITNGKNIINSILVDMSDLPIANNTLVPLLIIELISVPNNKICDINTALNHFFP